MIKYKDLNITMLKDLSPQAVELINKHELYNMCTNIAGILLISFIVFIVYKAE